MEFNAFKMDGLGNDFVIIDQRDEIINLKPSSTWPSSSDGDFLNLSSMPSNLFVKFSNIF